MYTGMFSQILKQISSDSKYQNMTSSLQKRRSMWQDSHDSLLHHRCDLFPSRLGENYIVACHEPHLPHHLRVPIRYPPSNTKCRH